MPSTYSTNLKLELMATGEDSGTWGDNTNNNLGTLIEEAIIGTGTVAMADSNQTIAIANGVTSTARKVFITCTGALSAGRNLTVPTISKNYVITNATTGGFAVTVKTAAGTGIAVLAGQSRFLLVDGTNVVEMINSTGPLNVNGALTLTTPLGTASGGTGTSSSTGTGALVLQTSPTLITPVLGVAAATSINKVAITAPATSATLTIIDGTTVTGPPASGTMATLAGTETLTNKTLTAPTINTGALGAASTATTQTAGDNSTKLATTAYVDRLTSSSSAVLAALVAFTDTVTFFPGPKVSQGSTGTWLAIATATMQAGATANFIGKLWDGTNTKATPIGSADSSAFVAMTASGIFTAPPGDIRFDIRNSSDASGAIIANASTLGMDSSITVIRIA